MTSLTPRSWWRTAITNLDSVDLDLVINDEVRTIPPKTSLLLTPDEWKVNRVHLSHYAIQTRHLTLPASSTISFLPPRPSHA